jgi:heat shock protein HtpX
MGNVLKTGLLLTALTLLLVWLGNLIGGQVGLVVALVFAALMNLGSYWFSDRLVIAMSGARPLSESEAPELYAMVRRLAQRAGLPMPRLYSGARDAAERLCDRDATHNTAWSPSRRGCCR